MLCLPPTLFVPAHAGSGRQHKAGEHQHLITLALQQVCGFVWKQCLYLDSMYSV